MKISPINTGLNHVTGTNKVKNQKSFGSKLCVSHDVENLIKVQALQASRGNTDIYTELVGGFGHFMEDLSSKLKNIGSDNQIVSVDLNPLLREYLDLPQATRGSYKRDQLCILLGLPQLQEQFSYYSFTYRPGSNGLADKLCDCVKNLLQNK